MTKTAVGRLGALGVLLSLSCSGARPPGPAPTPAAGQRGAKPDFVRVEPTSEARHPMPPGMKALAAEIDRAMAGLRARGELAPYFIGQQLMDVEMVGIGAENGALTGSIRSRLRTLLTDVRVQRLLGAHADFPINAEHGVSAVEAYLVDGSHERAVRGLTIERIDLRALKDLLGTGDAPYVLNQSPIGQASIVTPSLLLGDVDVKRHEAENPKSPSYPPP